MLLISPGMQLYFAQTSYIRLYATMQYNTAQLLYCTIPYGLCHIYPKHTAKNYTRLDWTGLHQRVSDPGTIFYYAILYHTITIVNARTVCQGLFIYPDSSVSPSYFPNSGSLVYRSIMVGLGGQIFSPDTQPLSPPSSSIFSFQNQPQQHQQHILNKYTDEG